MKKSNNLLVSIITPCYNCEAFISQAIQSVIFQTYFDWELIIIDDCSTDFSAFIIKEYCKKDSRIRYLKTNKCSGSPVVPRNIGIRNAKGRFIAFLDSDDIWYPQKLEEQLPLFENSSTAIVYSNYEKIDEKGSKNQRIVKAPTNSISYRELLKGNTIGNLTGIYDRKKVGTVYFKNVFHEDYVFWLSILKQGYNAQNTGKLHALYRIRKSSISANKMKALRWQWFIYRKIENLNRIQSTYYFINYAVKAFIKSNI